VFSSIVNVISFIRSLFSFLKVLNGLIEKTRLAAAEKRRQELDAAIAALTNAKTPEEIANAQKAIVKNSPH
jgi:crotonobetainyl-CoA:carnitine CoA-transferase CaiB-like acyl-CoA transferase